MTIVIALAMTLSAYSQNVVMNYFDKPGLKSEFKPVKLSPYVQKQLTIDCNVASAHVTIDGNRVGTTDMPYIIDGLEHHVVVYLYGFNVYKKKIKVKKPNYTLKVKLSVNKDYKDKVYLSPVNGGTYIGEINHKLPNGKGTMYFRNGDTYTGYFINGKRHGEGVYTYADKTEVSGYWIDDMIKDGRGWILYDDASRYFGDIKNGTHEGSGILFFDEDLKYNGGWSKGKRNGRGLLSKYEHGKWEPKQDGIWKDNALIMHIKKYREDLSAGKYAEVFYYDSKTGETLESIAKVGGFFLSDLLSLNNYKADEVLAKGTRIILKKDIYDEIYQVVEQMPEFPGGQPKLLEYMAKIKYPAEAQERNIQGRVLVSFVVNKDGSIVDVEIVKSVDRLLDKAAKEHISKMPKWIPGKQRGKPVRVKYTVPVSFRLN